MVDGAGGRVVKSSSHASLNFTQQYLKHKIIWMILVIQSHPVIQFRRFRGNICLKNFAVYFTVAFVLLTQETSFLLQTWKWCYMLRDHVHVHGYTETNMMGLYLTFLTIIIFNTQTDLGLNLLHTLGLWNEIYFQFF